MINIKDIENTIINDVCLNILKELHDKCVDFILTDPPYGIDYTTQVEHKCTDGKNGWRKPLYKDWDKEKPSKEIFDEIFRVSKNQIIWGGNYQRRFSLADGELAWTSFDKALRIFDYARAKQLNAENREHPTQKPLKLFEWCLDKFSNENDLVLDCFSGSGTTAIACHNLKRRFICIEKDKEYFEKSVKRLDIARSQLRLF